MSNNRVLGRTVPARKEARQAVVSLATRPQRIGFLIGQDFAFEDLVRVIRYNTTIWGGIFNALVPTDGDRLSDGWWRTLEDHSPDIVVTCGNVGEELAKEVRQRLQPLLVRGWQGLLLEEHQVDRLNNIPMLTVLAEVLETATADDAGSAIRIPSITCTHPFFQYAAPQLGVLDDVYGEIYTQHLHAPTVRFDEAGDFCSYLRTVSSILERMYPLQLTKYRLKPTVLAQEGTPSRIILCLAGDNYVEDLCAFWSIRMGPRFGPGHTIFLPMQPLESKENLEQLAEWCNQRLVGTNVMAIASSSVGAQELKSFRSRLAPLLRDEIEFVDLWVSHFSMGRFLVSHEHRREEVTWQGNHTRVRRPLPAFANQYLRSGAKWMLDLDLADPVRRQQGFIPPNFPRVNHILNGRPKEDSVRLGGYWVRNTHDVLSRRVTRSPRSEFVRIVLPSEADLFSELLEAFGHNPRLTDKCRYVSGMIELLNRAGVVELLRDPLFRTLFERLTDKRKAYSLNGIHGLVQCPDDQKKDFRTWLSDLARDGILLRGYQLKCLKCNLLEWYALSEVSETMSCAGCLTVFQMPFNAEFSYRLNRLVELGMEQGAVPVILTMMLLSNLSRKSLLRVPGIKAVQQDREVDIDILASCDGHLVAVECKDLMAGCGEETATEIAEQLREVYEVSRDINAEVVFLSMMTNERPPVLVELLNELNERDGPSVHLLLLDDLERGYPVKPTESFFGPKEAGKPRKASLSDMLPKVSHDQRWIKEDGQRRVSF